MSVVSLMEWIWTQESAEELTLPCTHEKMWERVGRKIILPLRKQKAILSNEYVTVSGQQK